MAWKKAWPSEFKQKLKAMGLGDKDIKTLEDYGSLNKLKNSGVYLALTEAKQKQLDAALAESGLRAGGSARLCLADTLHSQRAARFLR